jgi:hypothetical protein
MPDSRRRLLQSLAALAAVLAGEPALSGVLAQTGMAPKAKPYPNGRDPNIPPGLDEPSTLDPKAIEQANQKKLRADVAKLLDMASELKQEVDKTDATSTLPLSVVKKAQQIEKLAKQIRDLAKG